MELLRSVWGFLVSLLERLMLLFCSSTRTQGF